MTFGKSFEDIELNPYKYITHLDKLRTLAKDGDIFPVTVELDLVDYCNHGCNWCVDPVHLRNSLERSFVSELLSELKSLGIEGIVFKGGGESTLYKSFSDVIQGARTLDFEVGIVTNGSKLTQIYPEVIANSSYLRVSIDGPTKKSHKTIHRSDDFDDIVNGTYKAVELRNSLQQRHPIIGISFAMDYSMVNLVNDAINLGDKLGVDYVLLRPPFLKKSERKYNGHSTEKGDSICI